jgi:hypothetical protein
MLKHDPPRLQIGSKGSRKDLKNKVVQVLSIFFFSSNCLYYYFVSKYINFLV